MNIRQIEHFVAIVEHGGFHAAAANLGISQPALTKSIAALEADLETTLLSRSRGKATDVTVFGRLIYERGLKLLADLADTRRSVELLRDGHTAQVRIGFGAAMSARSTSQIAAAVQTKQPKSMIVIRTGMQHELISKLRAKQLDFLVLSGLSPDSYSDLAATSLWRDSFMVFMGSSHPLARHSKYDPEWATQWDWLSSEKLVNADDKAAIYLGHNSRTITPSQFDVHDPAIIAELLSRQNYLSAWPSLSFESELENGVLHGVPIPAVDGHKWESETFLVRSRGQIMPSAVQEAWRVVQGLSLCGTSSQDG